MIEISSNGGYQECFLEDSDSAVISIIQFYKDKIKQHKMQKNKGTEDESSSKVSQPELKEFSILIDREAYRKQLTRKTASLNQLEKVSASLWEPKFELEDFNVPPKEEQLIRVHSEPLMNKERILMLVEEERESPSRGTKRVRSATTNAPKVSGERRLESISGTRFDLDLNKGVEDSFSSN